MTLIELLVTLSIVVILATVAVPGFSELLSETRRIASLNQLVGSLSLARSEAIKSNAAVTICKSRNPNQVNPVCDLDASWGDGWLVFQDNTHEPGNLLGAIDGSDQLLRVVVPDQSLTINTGANYARGVSYDSTGVVWGISGSGNRTIGNDTFTIVSGDTKICLTINKSGRSSMRAAGQRSCAR